MVDTWSRPQEQEIDQIGPVRLVLDVSLQGFDPVTTSSIGRVAPELRQREVPAAMRAAACSPRGTLQGVEAHGNRLIARGPSSRPRNCSSVSTKAESGMLLTSAQVHRPPPFSALSPAPRSASAGRTNRNIVSCFTSA
jgi:hypothetical protein